MYLHKSTVDGVKLGCLREMVVNHRHTLIGAIMDILRGICSDDFGSSSTGGGGESESKGGDGMDISPQARENLQNMYDLFEDCHRLNPHDTDFDLIQHLSQGYNDYVMERGSGILQGRTEEIEEMRKEKKKPSAGDFKMINQFISLQHKMDQILHEIFNGSRLFLESQTQAFKGFFNQELDVFSTNEMLCKYVDGILKGSIKCSHDDERREILDDCISLFSYLNDKDIFAETYRDLMGTRMLSKRVVSDDMEKHVITRLKVMCGSPFTSKLEGMMNDFTIAKDSEEAFGVYFNERRGDYIYEEGARNMESIDFSAKVLTKSFWPTHRLHTLTLPLMLQYCTTTFEDWYKSANDSRKLEWVNSLGEMALSCPFPTAKKFVFYNVD